MDLEGTSTPSKVTLDNYKESTPFDVKLYSPILNIGESDMHLFRLVNSDSEESTNEDTKHDYFQKGMRRR